MEIGAKSEHKVMVPISNVAFFPQGRIKHPNEFLVAVGDNYFIQRTSQECQPILDRRISKLKE
jgi:prefoldin subunit 5